MVQLVGAIVYDMEGWWFDSWTGQDTETNVPKGINQSINQF